LVTDILKTDIRQNLTQFDNGNNMLEAIDKHSRTLESQLEIVINLAKTMDERSRTLESQLETVINLAKTMDERSRTLESQLEFVINLAETMEGRSRTLEFLERQCIDAAHYKIDFLQRLYVELMPTVLELNQKASFNASSILTLKTDYPIAVNSNDHINPDSTTDGVSRPTFFVQDCIRIMGHDIKCIDLGSGSAGLIFEYAMNDILAVGVDGSDFCLINQVGYWPLLKNNLFTCDITKPFRFLSRDTEKPFEFDIITMWEVLEHIGENDLSILFRNIKHHLSEKGYFIGSISLIEYNDSDGNAYHLTLKSSCWWKDKFKENGFLMLDSHPFNQKFFCRGNGPCFEDFHNYEQNPNEGFWFVAQKKEDNSSSHQ
jgi:hypothetical protein